MPKIILLIVVLIGVLVFSRSLRAAVFHVRVRQFFVIVFFVTVALFFAALCYVTWKYLWPLYMKQPTVLMTDTTLEHDENPVTPGAGGPYKPTVIQVR